MNSLSSSLKDSIKFDIDFFVNNFYQRVFSEKFFEFRKILEIFSLKIVDEKLMSLIFTSSLSFFSNQNPFTKCTYVGSEDMKKGYSPFLRDKYL